MIKHILTGEELSTEKVHQLIQQGQALKALRQSRSQSKALSGKTLALLFDKPSLRTRFSFSIAMRELGGEVIESLGETRKSETPEDLARVLNGYCHGVMVRCHEDQVLTQMAAISSIPIINGLSNLHHPCQILADLMTIKEQFGTISGLTLAYIGDGNNVLNSLIRIASPLGIRIHYACPKGRGPDCSSEAYPQTQAFDQPSDAVKGAQIIYTDVWTSMGFENTAEDHLFEDFQVNESLMKLASPDAIFMHCMPMVRGKEVSHTLPDQAQSVIFQQSENRLHIQKALLLHCLGENP